MMSDLAAALLLWLALTGTPARADSREPRFPANALRFSDRPSHARRTQQDGSFSNYTLANHTLSNNDSLVTLSSSSSSSSAIPASSGHSLFTSTSTFDGFSESTYQLPTHSTSSASADSPEPSIRLTSISSLSHNTAVNASRNSSVSDTLHLANSQSEPHAQPPQSSSAGNITSSRPYASSFDSSESLSLARLGASAPLPYPKVTANSSAPWHQSSVLRTAATSAFPAPSMYASKLPNATAPISISSYTGLANNTRVKLGFESPEVDNTTTAKPNGPRPTCHPSYIAALNNGIEGTLKTNTSDELCDACPRTAEVLKYQSRPAPGVDQIGHDYAMSCNIAWLQYSKHSSLWWELVGSKSTSHHPMSTGSTSRVLGRAAEPTVLADGFTRMKGASTKPGAWVPTATEEVPTERLPPPTTSTTYHKACLDPKMRASQNFHTRFPNRKPQCEIGPAQCQYLNHKHAAASEDDDDDDDDEQGVQAPICGNRAFNHSTCSIYASKVQIFYWPDATDVHKSHMSTTPAPTTKPRSAVVGGHTMLSPYVYLSLQHIGLAKTWIVDFTSRSAATDLPEATNTLLQLAPELLSTVVYTVPGCKGLCANHLQSMFSTPPSGDPRRRLHFTAQPYNPATVNHSEPVPASAYFWGRVDAGTNLGRVPLPLLYYHPRQQIIWDDYLPQIAVPNDIRKLGPNGTWEGCGLGMGGIYDPPYALEPGSTVAAPDVTPPGGFQPTSTPALPANGYPQAPAPTAFGDPAMPVLTPPPSGPANSQPSSPAPSKPAVNAFGNPLVPGAPSAVAPSDESISLSPTSFGQSISISSNSAGSPASSEPLGTVPAASDAQNLPYTTNTNSLAAEPVNDPNGVIAVAFNPNEDPIISDASTGILTPSTPGSGNPVLGSGGLPGSSSGDSPSITGSLAPLQSLPSVAEGAVVAMSLPSVALSSTSIPSGLDAASYATSPVLPDLNEGLYQPSRSATGGAGALYGGAGADGASSSPSDQDDSALSAFNKLTSSAAAQGSRPSRPKVPSPSAIGTNAFATHTLIRNIFGDVVATAALVAGQTIVAGGPAATIDGNIVSLSPGGRALMLNGATAASFATTTGQTSLADVNSATASRAMVTGADSATTTGVALYGTTLTAGGPSLVYLGHTYSAEPSGNVVVDGSRTVQVQALSTSSTTSTPKEIGTSTLSTGTITTAAMTIGSTETLCATETAVTDLGGTTHNVVYIGSQSASVGQTITAAGMAVTVASTGLIYNGSTARFKTTTTVGLSSPKNPSAASVTGSSTALNPFQAGNMPSTGFGSPRAQSSSSRGHANAVTSANSFYLLLGAVGAATVSMSLAML